MKCNEWLQKGLSTSFYPSTPQCAGQPSTLIMNWPSIHSFSQSFIHSLTHSFVKSVSQSANQSVNETNNHPVIIQSAAIAIATGQSINQSVSQPRNQSASSSIHQPASYSVIHSVSHLANPTTCHEVSQTVHAFTHPRIQTAGQWISSSPNSLNRKTTNTPTKPNHQPLILSKINWGAFHLITHYAKQPPAPLVLQL